MMERPGIPNEYFCPITTEIMEDPVIAVDGHTYERSAIEEWLKRGNRRSPAAGFSLDSTMLIPNVNLRKLIQDFKAEQPVLAQYKLNEENMLAAVKLHEEEMYGLLADKDQLLNQEKERNLVLESELEETKRRLKEQALRNTINTLDKLVAKLDEINLPRKPSVPRNSFAPSAPPASRITPHMRPIRRRLPLQALPPLETWFEAARNSNFKRMEFLLAKGTSIEEKDSNGLTALLSAAWEGRIEVVRWLIAKGASTEAKDQYDHTPLILAAWADHLEIVRYLLIAKASIEEKNINGCNALQTAIWQNRLEIVKLLLANGASIKERDSNGNTPLLTAASYDHLDMVKLLLANGASIKERDNGNNSALLIAAWAGHLDLVKWLLTEGGADVHDRNNDNMPASSYRIPNTEVKLFVSSFRNQQLEQLKKNPQLFSAALFAAVEEGHVKKVEWLIDTRLVLEGDENNNTILLIAARFGHLMLVQSFVNEASIKTRDENGNTALLIAVSYGHLEVVKWLLTEGHANINDRNNNKQTALNLTTSPEVKKFLEDFLKYFREKNSWSNKCFGMFSSNPEQTFQSWSDSHAALRRGSRHH